MNKLKKFMYDYYCVNRALMFAIDLFEGQFFEARIDLILALQVSFGIWYPFWEKWEKEA